MGHGNTQASSVADYFRAVYELPLGAASFVLFKLLRKLVHRIAQITYRKYPGTSRRWKVLSEEAMEEPHFSLGMVSGPRWNPHAVIASVGPISVEREVTIPLGDTVKEVGYWFFGALHFPTFASMGYVSSLTDRGKEDCISLDLPPGDYFIVCRYYGWPETVRYPPVCIDGQEVIDPKEVPGSINDFYPNLPARDSVLYRVVHYHVYVMLKYPRLFSRGFVKRHLLPLGNEDTRYIYGTVEKGEALTVTVDPAMFRDHRLFCSFYNTASLPVRYWELYGQKFVSESLPCRGIYLIRVMQNGSSSDAVSTMAGAIAVAVLTPAAGVTAVP